jgi:hypothetical protein
MIIQTTFLPATNTQGSRIRAKAGSYHATWGYYDLIGDSHGSAYVHRNAVSRMLALLGVDVHGPVVVDAGEERDGYRFAILNGPASLRAAQEKAQTLGVDAGSLLCPVRLCTPLVPEDGERVQLAPHLWPTHGQYGTVVKRVGGTGFRVALDTGKTVTVSRGAIL